MDTEGSELCEIYAPALISPRGFRCMLLPMLIVRAQLGVVILANVANVVCCTVSWLARPVNY